MIQIQKVVLRSLNNINNITKQSSRNYFKSFVLQTNYRFATKTLYSQDHEWVTVDTETKQASIGITDYAQEQLGDIVHVQFGSLGDEFKVGESGAALESVKVVADLVMPLSGSVTQINKEVEANPAIINEGADTTWILQIQANDLSELSNLMTKEKYEEFLKSL